jgi:starch phosphorylase
MTELQKKSPKLPKPAPRGSDPSVLAAEIIERLTYRIGKNAVAAQPHDWLAASILVIRDHVIDRWIMATEKTYEEGGKRV